MADASNNDNAQQQKKKKKSKQSQRNVPVELPEFVKHRITVWDELFEKQETKRKAAADENKAIEVTLPDGKKMSGVAFATTPLDIAKEISNGLAQAVIVALVDGKVWDLARVLENDCELELCKFDHHLGEYTFWHSSAHVLGEAIELNYEGSRLCIGPPIDDGGFYYDVSLPEGTVVTPADFKALENQVQKIRKQKQKFVRLELTKDEAKEMFKFNKFKQEIIDKIPDGEQTTAYRCGPLIDLCRGPHIPHSGKIKAMTVTRNSSAYWMGNAENDSLQRVYGISFPDTTKMKEWKRIMEEAAKRDHRLVGTQQELFFFDNLSPGSCFFMPHGTRLYNTLVQFIRGEYRKRGYDEVVTPNVYNCDLWRQSGHYQNYQENMFIFEVENEEFAMKPMNCPGHCVMFGHRLRSSKELPIRLADFGVLHRNELSGALTGLTRVRRFQQDDAHIFCRNDQIKEEVGGVLDMLQHVYGCFGFTFSLKLSTRPEKYMGELAVWDEAEKQLAECLDDFKVPWTVDEGDGAFYGPKIDIQLLDALKRKHQCATIQLDFQLPIRFDLEFNHEGKFERPVIIHRAILGSVERMIAVLIEHTAGKWPLWLNPRQLLIVPVDKKFNGYAEQVRQRYYDAGFYVDVDDSNDKFKKKIRNGQLKQYSFIAVVGAKEEEDETVNVRNRDDQSQTLMSVDESVEFFSKLVAEYK